MVIFNLVSLLHHHTAGHTNRKERGGGQSRGWNACRVYMRRQLLNTALLSKQLLLELWPTSHLQPVQPVEGLARLEVRRPLSYNSKQILLLQLFSICWRKCCKRHHSEGSVPSSCQHSAASVAGAFLYAESCGITAVVHVTFLLSLPKPLWQRS